MQSNVKKQYQLTARDLLLKGYTVAEAARCINRTRGHVNAVLRGERISASCMRMLHDLPVKSGKYSVIEV